MHNSIKRNSLLSDKSSIIPAAAKSTFNIPSVEKTAERVTDRYNAEEVEYFTEVVRKNLDYWHWTIVNKVDRREKNQKSSSN